MSIIEKFKAVMIEAVQNHTPEMLQVHMHDGERQIMHGPWRKLILDSGLLSD